MQREKKAIWSKISCKEKRKLFGVKYHAKRKENYLEQNIMQREKKVLPL